MASDHLMVRMLKDMRPSPSFGQYGSLLQGKKYSLDQVFANILIEKHAAEFVQKVSASELKAKEALP